MIAPRPTPEKPSGIEMSTRNKKLADYVRPEVLLPVLIDPNEEPPYTGDLTAEEMLEDQKKILLEINKKFPPEFREVLKRLSYYLSIVGLDFEEACLMVRFDPEDMAAKIKEFPIIQELIDIKELEYKVALIKTVSHKATTGDDKLAQWLLERRFPQEFNPKKGSGVLEKSNDDLMGMAIEFIQRNSDTNPLIKETSGRAFLFKKNSGEDIVTAVNQILK